MFGEIAGGERDVPVDNFVQVQLVEAGKPSMQYLQGLLQRKGLLFVEPERKEKVVDEVNADMLVNVVLFDMLVREN
jgi:hypothetical protein